MMVLDDGTSSVGTLSSSKGLVEHSKNQMGSKRYAYTLTTRIGNDPFGSGSVWLAGGLFGVAASMINSRLLEARSVNEPTALPTTERPMDFSRKVGIAKTPASEKLGRASTDISLTPGAAEVP